MNEVRCWESRNKSKIGRVRVKTEVPAVWCVNSPEHAEARQDQAPVRNLLGQRKEAELQVDAQHVKTSWFLPRHPWLLNRVTPRIRQAFACTYTHSSIAGRQSSATGRCPHISFWVTGLPLPVKKKGDLLCLIELRQNSLHLFHFYLEQILVSLHVNGFLQNQAASCPLPHV